MFGLLQDGKYPNCNTMAVEFEVAAKTVWRDLDCMRERWELPVEYDEKRDGFFFSKPEARFPGVPVTEKELFALCVAHKAVEQYHGTALQQPLWSDARLTAVTGSGALAPGSQFHRDQLNALVES